MQMPSLSLSGHSKWILHYQYISFRALYMLAANRVKCKFPSLILRKKRTSPNCTIIHYLFTALYTLALSLAIFMRHFSSYIFNVCAFLRRFGKLNPYGLATLHAYTKLNSFELGHKFGTFLRLFYIFICFGSIRWKKNPSAYCNRVICISCISWMGKHYEQPK